MEQPVWNPETGRFLITVPGKIANGAVVTPASIQVINPTSMMSEKTYPLDCQALANLTSVGTTGLVIGPHQHVLVSACGFPIILTLDANTGKINPLNVIKQVGGGDEIWHNPGDSRFYVTGVDMTNAMGVQSLGVIDSETSGWLQNVPVVRGKNPAALPGTNRIYTIVQITAAIAGNPATDDSACTRFGFKGTGCIGVFAHAAADADQ